jgi:hypothetical protein
VCRDRYLQAISYVLRGIKQENATADTNPSFNINQRHSLKVAVELIVSIGVIPGLLPGLDRVRLRPRALKISQEERCLEVIYFIDSHKVALSRVAAMIPLDDCPLEFFT